MIIKRWAVRKKGTNLYLPELKNRKGYSFYEPEECGGAYGPRFFRNWRSAHNGLVAWALGKWKYYAESTYDGGVEEYWAPKKVEGRNKADFEIVEFDVVEVVASGVGNEV